MKKIILFCTLVIILTGCTSYKEEARGNNKNNKPTLLSTEQALEIIKEKYKEMENSYTEIIGTTPTIYENDKTYYTLSNYNELTNIYTDKMLKKYNEDNNVIKKNDTYYSCSLPRYKIDYDEITYTEISVTENKIKYKVLLYKCTEKEEEKCKNFALTTNPFDLEKVNEEWKIANYKAK